MLTRKQEVFSLKTMKSSDRDTTFDKMLQNEEVTSALVNAPDEIVEDMIEQRRKQIFKFLWDTLTMEKAEVLTLIEQREDDFIEEYSEYELPDWLMRMEVQDKLHNRMAERFEEKGII